MTILTAPGPTTATRPGATPPPAHADGSAPTRTHRQSDAGAPGDLLERAGRCLDAAAAALFAKLRTERFHDAPGEAEKRGEGDLLHWCAELEGDSILSSEYLLMKLILGQEHDRQAPARGGPNYLQRIANHLRLVQREDGTWGQYPGSPPDISACVKAYVALKAFGDDVDAPHMRKARERILEIGGAEKCNTFSTFYLACLGCVDWDACPSIPPEIVLFPRWFPFHLDKVAAWTRTMILPLALCTALRPVRRFTLESGRVLDCDELFVDLRFKHRLAKPFNRDEPACWKNFFLVCDRVLKVVQKLNLSPLRQESIRLAEKWILERVDGETTEGLGAIFPPMVYLQVAFQALGYSRDHPVIRRAEKDLDDFIVVHEHADPRLDHVRLQPCFSPVWDTGIALYALTEAGYSAASDDRIARVCDWLIARQVRMGPKLEGRIDWSRNLRPQDRSIRLGVDASAWAFEYKNDWYPDIDDTAMIAKAMWRASEPGNGSAPGDPALAEYRRTAQAAARWVFAMQNDDGGWAAFDRTWHHEWMEEVPFADHNAMQDPSCADITGRTIESLITCGVSPEHPQIQLAVQYLLNKQEPEGCWWGRWGVNYIYGTWQAMGGLTFAGLPKDHPSIRRAIHWIKSVQNPDGGFGESANSYLDRSLMGKGPSTASQTAWGLACLLYACEHDDAAVVRAVRWLCDHQLAADKAPFTRSRCIGGAGVEDAGASELAPTDFQADLAGSWNEHYFTGTGFPKVFYLRYNAYRHYFPVMSLARWVNRARMAAK
jgi:squalene-hopene/tetraprenyl-beta-curcumene cyclase